MLLGRRIRESARPKLRSQSLVTSGAAGVSDISPVGVLFDFDGTLADTESFAMEVAFWAMAPYLPDLADVSEAELEAACLTFQRENAGKAFAHVIKDCDAARSAAGLAASADETRARREETPALLAKVDTARICLGLSSIADIRTGLGPEEPATLLAQLQGDTMARLAQAARPALGVLDALRVLQQENIPVVIATTGGKPRVQACVDTAGLRQYFPSDVDHIHSGASDFSPPRFKPDPAVYLRAAHSVGRDPGACIAVEDSASGIGSAANAGIGLIVGYVGASHIAPEMKESHARSILKGSRSENGRGADIVISDMRDLPKVAAYFAEQVSSGARRDNLQFLVPVDAIPDAVGLVFTHTSSSV